MVLSLEQLLVDVEMFRMARRARQGIATADEKWLDAVIHSAGPGGHFIEERSTVAGIRGGEWVLPDIGLHDTYERWAADGKRTLLDEVREKVNQILTTHDPLPLDKDAERELDRILDKAREVSD
jgi:trimethylamine--corrinoid protein Co-methyltransferase